MLKIINNININIKICAIMLAKMLTDDIEKKMFWDNQTRFRKGVRHSEQYIYMLYYIYIYIYIYIYLYT